MILPGNLAHTLPKVVYDEVEGRISVTGRIIAPDVEDYFAEFLPYLRDCLRLNPMNITVIMDIEYFSTRASKVIMEFFYILKKEITDKKRFTVDVTWYYEAGDIDMLECGEDYEGLTNFNFKFIEKDI
jgi:hypothetical protein